MFILLVTFIAVHGVDKIAKVASIGGVFAFAISILFSLFSIIVLIAHHGVLAEEITGLKSLKFHQIPTLIVQLKLFHS